MELENNGSNEKSTYGNHPPIQKLVKCLMRLQIWSEWIALLVESHSFPMHKLKMNSCKELYKMKLILQRIKKKKKQELLLNLAKNP